MTWLKKLNDEIKLQKCSQNTRLKVCVGVIIEASLDMGLLSSGKCP